MKILVKYYEHSMHGHKRMQAQNSHYWKNHRAQFYTCAVQLFPTYDNT